jgi:metal-responsive CopG/Arc/MetJ family transcriptional regulator
MRRALVSLPDGVWNIIDTDLKGQIGDGDSEVIRNLVISYLTEKGYLLKGKVNSEQQQQTDKTEQIASELDIHDTMITALTELLEEKGQLNPEEWEKRVQKKLHQYK